MKRLLLWSLANSLRVFLSSIDHPDSKRGSVGIPPRIRTLVTGKDDTVFHLPVSLPSIQIPPSVNPGSGTSRNKRCMSWYLIIRAVGTSALSEVDLSGGNENPSDETFQLGSQRSNKVNPRSKELKVEKEVDLTVLDYPRLRQDK